MQDHSDAMLTVRGVMATLHVSRSTVFRLMREKGLPSVKIGTRTLRFEQRAIERWVQEQISKDTVVYRM